MSTQGLLVAFGIGAAVCVLVTTVVARRNPVHAWWRCLAWVATWALVVLAAPVWERDPMSLRQGLSWGLIVVSVVPMVLGVAALQISGEPEVAGRFSAPTRLVTSGIFARIRHPMYTGMGLLGLGVWVKDISWPGVAALVALGVGLWNMAGADERECLARFGDEYEDYLAHSKRFIPGVI